jgi:hypothetical protein
MNKVTKIELLEPKKGKTDQEQKVINQREVIENEKLSDKEKKKFSSKCSIF